ncbi:Arf-GAP with SH3 domain, ANK repeat and PH domain-containing protein 3 [Merluccius polli]|uniref:Arf-GAP with SH3 domain, ANK repeat and PH domain-containing protein 3 n=1 Tax=Merluccius polli TaxID=89951 RepID=A0AA47NDJ6_MERPO|nr:Arf-GAP with SH3 domain, ANK repeat and PH domain-containing protein 3 [Merluccius polli]
MTHRVDRQDGCQVLTHLFSFEIPFYEKSICVCVFQCLDLDQTTLQRMKKLIKAIHSSGLNHVDNKEQYTEVLENLGNSHLIQDDNEVSTGFLNLAVFTREVTSLFKNLGGVRGRPAEGKELRHRWPADGRLGLSKGITLRKDSVAAAARRSWDAAETFRGPVEILSLTRVAAISSSERDAHVPYSVALRGGRIRGITRELQDHTRIRRPRDHL